MGFDLCERGERGECESNSSFYFELFRGGQCITIYLGDQHTSAAQAFVHRSLVLFQSVWTKTKTNIFMEHLLF